MDALQRTDISCHHSQALAGAAPSACAAAFPPAASQLPPLTQDVAEMPVHKACPTPEQDQNRLPCTAVSFSTVQPPTTC